MAEKKVLPLSRICVDCGRDISRLHHNATRCKACARKRKQLQDQERHEQGRSRKLQWLFFTEDQATQELTHRSAKGSKLRYWLDKICKQLTVQDLDFLLILWDWRTRGQKLTPDLRREYRTCAGIVRDWRDYNVINHVFDGSSFDAETGVIFNPDGSYLTVDFDENNESYLIRNSEGTIICQY
jgi:hypothetical protein